MKNKISFFYGIFNIVLSILPTFILSRLNDVDYATWFVLLSLLPIFNLIELGASQYLLSIEKKKLKNVFYSYSSLATIIFILLCFIIVFIYDNINIISIFLFLIGAYCRIILNMMFALMVSNNEGEYERKIKFILHLSFILPIFILMSVNFLSLNMAVLIWFISSSAVFIYVFLVYIGLSSFKISLFEIKNNINLKESFFITFSGFAGLFIFNFPMYYFNFNGINNNANNLIVYGILLQIINFSLQFSYIICSYKCSSLKKLKNINQLNNYFISTIFFLFSILIGMKIFLPIVLSMLKKDLFSQHTLFVISLIVLVEIYQVSFTRILIINGVNNFIVNNLVSSLIVVSFNILFELSFEQTIYVLIFAQIVSLLIPILIKIYNNFNINILRFLIFFIGMLGFDILIHSINDSLYFMNLILLSFLVLFTYLFYKNLTKE